MGVYNGHQIPIPQYVNTAQPLAIHNGPTFSSLKQCRMHCVIPKLREKNVGPSI